MSTSMLPRPPIEPRHYSFARFNETVLPWLQAQEAKAPGVRYYILFMNRHRKDFLGLPVPPVQAITDAIMYTAKASRVGSKDLFTDVTVYGSLGDARDDLALLTANPEWTDIGYEDEIANLNVNAPGRSLRNREQAARVKAFSEIMDEREATGLPALPRDITNLVLPTYLLKPNRAAEYTRRYYGGKRLRSERLRSSHRRSRGHRRSRRSSHSRRRT